MSSDKQWKSRLLSPESLSPALCHQACSSPSCSWPFWNRGRATACLSACPLPSLAAFTPYDLPLPACGPPTETSPPLTPTAPQDPALVVRGWCVHSTHRLCLFLVGPMAGASVHRNGASPGSAHISVQRFCGWIIIGSSCALLHFFQFFPLLTSPMLAFWHEGGVAFSS